MVKESTLHYDRDKGEKVVQKVDGSLTLETPTVTAVIDEDGNAHANLDRISSVSLANICHLKSYDLSKDEGGITRHRFSFVDDGGDVNLAYRQDGKLIEFAMHAVGQISITKEGAVTIRMKGEVDPETSS